MKPITRLLQTVLLFVFLLLELTFAGAPPIQWQKTFGGSNGDYGRSIQQTTDGGYIITGGTSSFAPGDPNVYLIKTDPNGNCQWQKTFGGSKVDAGYSIQQTTDGGYIVAGHTEDPVTGIMDVYLIKTDPNGNSQWQKTFGGSSYDYGSSVQQTSDGGYIIVGETFSFGSGAGDVYLIKTVPNGNIMWQKTFGGSNGDYGDSVQQTTDSGYIIAGETSSFDSEWGDVYLIKTDSNGNSQWQKTFGEGGTCAEWGCSVQQTSDGGYVVAGGIYPYYTTYDPNIYLVKTDPNGNIMWQKTFGGSDKADYVFSVQQTADDGYILAGETNPFDDRGKEVYLIKTDPNGNSQWQKTFGGNDSDVSSSVQQTVDGGYVIGGGTLSYGAGELDVYLIKLCPEGTLSADFNCNGTVYYEDLAILVDEWLQPPVMLFTDIFPEFSDGIVNGFDFAAFANEWLQTTLP